ncbi:MAG TPA: hypothetical protein VFW28_06430 [Micropepsaceae bacterium]|nr:hypothetical protein [Micropepsaceae bacterium]
MPVLIENGVCRFVRLEINPQEIPVLLAAHHDVWEPPDHLEATAQELCAQDFPDDRSARFAEEVIRWGGGHRFVGRFREMNANADIAEALRRAAALADQGAVSQAVAWVQTLNYLGQSFASKLVRFIRPERAVILDDVIRSSLGYLDNEQGYDEFLSDCRQVLDLALQEQPQLRVCDIEAAVFAKLQGYGG